jgi:hypothetical protein
MLNQGVCILRTRSGPADAEALQKAGYKIRYSSSILPDLLFSKRGISIALIFVANDNDFPPERFYHSQASQAVATVNFDCPVSLTKLAVTSWVGRVMEMKNGFRHAFVLASSKLTLEMAGCSTRCFYVSFPCKGIERKVLQNTF